MKIGALGKIVFYVSSSQIKTIRDLEIKASAATSVHNVHRGGGLLEWTGYDPRTISFKLRLSRYLGADPDADLKKLEEYRTKGTLLSFVLGGSLIGSYRWVLTEYSVAPEYYYKYGSETQCDVSVSLKEYLKG